MKMGSVLLAACLLLGSGLASGIDAPPASTDPGLERRVMEIAEELRCLVCQNQTIADSHAELAIDLKNQVRELLLKGKSEQEIKRYMVERYGDFVLYRPQVKGNTWLLWGGPFALLLGGMWFAVVKLRQRNKKVADTALLDEQSRKHAEFLLGVSQAQTGAPTETTKGQG